MLIFWFAVCHIALASATSIWHISIDERPAPPPDQGPPFSAHAIRDRGKLPITVVGILLAYVAYSIVIGTLLLTVGKRMRRQAMAPYDEPGTELRRSLNRLAMPRQSQETQESHWYSPRGLARKVSNARSSRSGSVCNSPGVQSTTSFDMRVLDADHRRRQNELERLYAAVLDHEEVMMSNEQLAEGEEDDDAIEQAPHPGQRVPMPRLITQQTRHRLDTSPISPSNPLSGRPIYPPHVMTSSPSPVHDWQRSTSAASTYHRSTSAASTYPRSPSAASTHELQDLLPARPDPLRRLGHSIRHLALQPRSPSADSQATPLATAAQVAPSGTPPTPSTAFSSPIRRRPPTPLVPRGEEVDTLSALPEDVGMTSLGSLPLRGMMSPGVTRTTFLDVRGQPGPRTGLPTPYSPYMPFTPMTPVTPRLVGRREARALRREEAHEGRGGGLVRGDIWE